MIKFITLEFTMKKYLLFYLVILPCALFSISSEEPIIPSEMLLSPDNSIIHTQVDVVDAEEDDLKDEEITEELSDTSPEYSTVDCNPLS